MMSENNNCYLSELYSAIQGEGPLVGVRQIFIRFSACDLRCVWCDTPGSLVRTKYCEIEEAAGNRVFKKVKNPINLDKLLAYISKLNPKIHHSLSLTGGEPLLQTKFLSLFLPALKEFNQIPVYLETGGHRPKDLKEIINYVDFISMDFKLPSSAKTPSLWEMHKEFLDIAIKGKNKKVYAKIVTTSKTLFSELKYSINLVKSFGNKIEVILQPVSKINGSRPPSSGKLLDIHSKLLKHYPHIRVLPQVHKLIAQK